MATGIFFVEPQMFKNKKVMHCSNAEMVPVTIYINDSKSVLFYLIFESHWSSFSLMIT